MKEWLDKLGSKTPAPGGGAVAGINAALSASVLKMVCEYSVGPKFTELDTDVDTYIDTLGQLIDESWQQAQNDENAYLALREAYSMPKGSLEEKSARSESVQNSLKGATLPAVKIIGIVDKILKIAQDILDKSNQDLISDIAVSAANARGALESAIVNIEINAAHIKDKDFSGNLSAQVSTAESLTEVSDKVVKTARQKISQRVK